MKNLLLVVLTTVISINGFTQTSGGNAFLIGNYVEVGIAGPGGYEGADLGVGTLPGVHWRSDAGNNLLGFVADPTMSGWVTFDGDFFTPGSPENGWGFEVGSTKASNNGMGDLEIPGSVTNWSNTNGCIQVDWHGTYANSGQDLSFDIVYKLNENELFYSTEVTVTNNLPTTINDFYYYRNIDPDNNEVLSSNYSTTNTIVSQPVAACSKALVSATQSSPWLSYLGIAAIGPDFRVAYGGFSNRDASNLWDGTGFTNTVGSSNFADEAIALAYRIPTLLANESKTFKFLIILDAAQADNAINNLFFFDYQGSLGGPRPECTPGEDTAYTCTSMPIILNLDGTGSPDFNWTWSPATGLSTTTGVITEAQPTTTTTYTITGVPINSCYTASISKDIVVNVLLGPEVHYLNPGNQCNTFDLSTLQHTDSNNVPGTIINFYSNPPNFAGDTTGIVSSTIINEGDSVYIVYADTLRGCFDYQLIDIQWGDGVIMDITLTDANCGIDNGSALVTAVNGGVAPYTYQWLGGPATNNYDSLGFGSYTITITDSLGCSTDSTIQINDLTSLSANIDTIIKSECGLANGSIEVVGVAGNPSYLFNIGLGNQTSGVFTNLLSGNYTINVSDQDGCNFLINAVITDTSTLAGSIVSIANTECGLTDGEVLVTGINGAAGYNYNIGAGNQTSGNFTNLAVGSYNVLITDTGGCTYNLPFVITDTNTLALSLLSLMDEGCSNNNGVIEVAGVNGAAPYLYNIGGANQSSGLFSGLSAGNYTITVTGNGGCFIDTTFTIVNILSNIHINLLNSSNENCGTLNGTFEVEAMNGNAPYLYNIGVGNQSSGIFTNLTTGNYTVSVTDSLGCTKDTLISIGLIPLTLDLGSDRIECQNFSLSSPTIGTYLWNTEETTQNITIETSGIYWLMLSTGGGLCVASDTISITRLLGSDIIISNVFSPNNDGMNDKFTIVGEFVENYTILIFNRWGQQIFESSDIDLPWDGGDAPSGTYFYVIEYDDPCQNAEKQLKKGTLTLFR